MADRPHGSLVAAAVQPELQLVPASLSRAIDERRPEAYDAQAALAANAGIDEAVGALLQKLLCQPLRDYVALRNRLRLEAVCIRFDWLESIKGCVKVSKPVVVFRYFPVRLLVGQIRHNHLRETPCLVIRDFRNRCLQIPGRVPCATGSIVEAGAEVAGVEERRSNNVGVRDAVHQLKLADAAQAIEFALETVIGRAIQQHDVREHRVVRHNVFEHRAAAAEARGDETVHPLPFENLDRRRSVLKSLALRCQRPPRHASSMRRTSTMPGWPWRSM